MAEGLGAFEKQPLPNDELEELEAWLEKLIAKEVDLIRGLVETKGIKLSTPLFSDSNQVFQPNQGSSNRDNATNSSEPVKPLDLNKLCQIISDRFEDEGEFNEEILLREVGKIATRTARRENFMSARADKDLDDFVQGVVLKVLESLDTFNGSNLRSFKAWVSAIAKNLINDSYRSLRKDQQAIDYRWSERRELVRSGLGGREPLEDPLEMIADPKLAFEQIFKDKAKRLLLLKALQEIRRISELQFRVTIQWLFLQCSQRDSAMIMKRSLSTIKSLRRRASQRMRKSISG